MIEEKKLQEIRDALENAQNPVVFFDDDPDGLVSYLLLKRKYERCYGVPLKVSMRDDSLFHTITADMKPDLVVILDRAEVSQEAIDGMNTTIVWLDHHPPMDRKGVKYYNPRLKDPSDRSPTSYWAYKVVKQDLWLALIGIFADWYIPEFLNESEHKELFEGADTPPKVLFETKYGILVKCIGFALKGKTTDVKKIIEKFLKIKDPYEILEQKTPEGKAIYKHYEKINQEYELILNGAIESATKDEVLVYVYPSDKNSFTGAISNELIYKFPDKLIVIAREKDGSLRVSLRSSSIVINKILPIALDGVKGYGGGHEYACGANIDKHDFDKFIEQLRIAAKKK